MRLSLLLFLPALLSVLSIALPHQQNESHCHTRSPRIHQDMSGREGDPPEKFFHESIFHAHYDGRYADHELGYRERKEVLTNSIQTYLTTMADIGVETWIMHGTLLGWWWNRKILPWDSDSDVQVTEATMSYLASFYNMTTYYYQTPRIPGGREYMLEINPHYINKSQQDSLNVIDARWVDMTSGLFIDITAVRYDRDLGLLECKDGHQYYKTEIFPLRDTFFEGTAAKIPFKYKQILEDEYTQNSLTDTIFEGHKFNEVTEEWVPINEDLDVSADDPFASPYIKPLSIKNGGKYTSEDKQTQYIYHPEEVDSETDTTADDNLSLSRPALNHKHISSEPMPDPSVEEQSAGQDIVSVNSHGEELVKKSQDEDVIALETVLNLQKKAERIEARCRGSRRKCF
ncbi:hypothetical protein HYALB_00003756 [Hymenoscyphus albidus]|uniref:LicD/FKTN/FKRP nucleotidyltransferase domain-containing protein n=1 Tax=Hymenoscyphus albidus TaxID=595503 RepID=A0A9N9LU78_9HELO|nr:hypothetical protein HYALB_00003756 [Hymenoscyphus albidus]